jgi:hypothetical protein
MRSVFVDPLHSVCTLIGSQSELGKICLLIRDARELAPLDAFCKAHA